MSSIKQMLTAASRLGSVRPSEAWRFVRQAVHEVHVVMNGATQLVADLDERLARLETEAAKRESAPAAATARARAPRRGSSRRRRAAQT